MRRNTIAILLFMCAFALAAVAQNEPASSPNSQMPAQTQSMPAQTAPPAQTTTPAVTTPDQNPTPAMPASDQTVAQNMPADQNAISQSLIQHERDSWDNAKSKNVSYFRQGLPDNVSAALPDGSTENKSTIEARVRKYGIGDYNLSNFNVTFPSADRAEVTYTASFSGKRPDGTAFNDSRQVTSQWQLTPGGTWENVRVDFR
jgi:hypothetical protein